MARDTPNRQTTLAGPQNYFVCGKSIAWPHFEAGESWIR